MFTWGTSMVNLITTKLPTWPNFFLTVTIISLIIFSSLFYAGWKKYKQTNEDKEIDQDEDL